MVAFSSKHPCAARAASQSCQHGCRLLILFTDRNTFLPAFYCWTNEPCSAAVVTGEGGHYFSDGLFLRGAEEAFKWGVNATGAASVLWDDKEHRGIKPLLLILYWSSVAIHFLHSVCWSDQKNSFTPASVSLSVGRGHCRVDVSRHWNLIMALQLNSGLPTFLYFSHLWFQQPASPGRLQNIISLMDGSAGWQEWMIALRSHLPQTVHWHK